MQATRQATICQAMPVSRPGPSKAVPAPTGPLVRPHGFSQARRTVPYAFNPALDSFGDGMGVPMASFVRPDCPPDAEDVGAAPQKKEKRGKAAPQTSRPQFRSALEQVPFSYTQLTLPEHLTMHYTSQLLSVACAASTIVVFCYTSHGCVLVTNLCECLVQHGRNPVPLSVQVSYMTNSKLWSEDDAEQAGQKFHPLRFLGL